MAGIVGTSGNLLLSLSYSCCCSHASPMTLCILPYKLLTIQRWLYCVTLRMKNDILAISAALVSIEPQTFASTRSIYFLIKIPQILKSIMDNVPLYRPHIK